MAKRALSILLTATLTCGALAAAIGFQTVEGALPMATEQPASTIDPKRRLVWSDEFDGDGLDTAVWTPEIGNGHAAGIPGWGNDELEYYTGDPANVTVEDGMLVITARQESRVDATGRYAYTSARIHTKAGFAFAHGLVEVRAKLPKGQGIWPAVWMLGTAIDQVGWPRAGEIDIIELVGNKPQTVHGTLHGPKSGGRGIGGSHSLQGDDDFSDEFHIFALDWNRNGLKWYVDGEAYFSLKRSDLVAGLGEAEWVFDEPFYFLVNVAVGGRWPGYPDDTTTFPQRLEIDYIRVYEPAP